MHYDTPVRTGYTNSEQPAMHVLQDTSHEVWIDAAGFVSNALTRRGEDVKRFFLNQEALIPLLKI